MTKGGGGGGGGGVRNNIRREGEGEEGGNRGLWRK